MCLSSVLSPESAITASCLVRCAFRALRCAVCLVQMQADGTNVCKAAGEQRTKPQRNHATADHSRARQRYVHDRSLEAQTPRLVWHHRRDTAEHSTYIHVHTYMQQALCRGQQVDNTSTAGPSTVRYPQVLGPICLWSSGRWVPGFGTWRSMSPGLSHDDIQCQPFLDAHVGAGSWEVLPRGFHVSRLELAICG